MESVGFAYLESGQIVEMTWNGSDHLAGSAGTGATLGPAHLLPGVVPLTGGVLFLGLMATK